MNFYPFFSESKSCKPICKFDEDCHENEVCYSNGKCIQTCSSMHSRCPDNHVCDHYEKACLPKCQSDQDCHQGLKCFSDGSCLKPCMADPECDGASEHCSLQLGACVPNCQNDNDCNQHQICVLNKCYETCATNRPNACPASHTCRSAQQVTKLLAFKKF